MQCYFNNTEQYIQTHPDKLSISVLKYAIRNNGCPDAKINDVVNGAIVQELNRIISPKESRLRTDFINQPFNPTYNELLGYIVNRFDGIESGVASSIINYLIQNKFIAIDDDDHIYKLFESSPRMLVSL